MADLIEETGTLTRDGAGFVLSRDAGGRYSLQLHRVPVDEVEKHVLVTGMLDPNGTLIVEGLRLAHPERD